MSEIFIIVLIGVVVGMYEWGKYEGKKEAARIFKSAQNFGTDAVDDFRHSIARDVLNNFIEQYGKK